MQRQRFSDVRLSRHFLLTDFLHDPFPEGGQPRVALTPADISEDQLAEGRALCEHLLEPLIEVLGPCSIAAGFGGAKVTGPHSWTPADGAAADVAFHDWVNADKAPVRVLSEMVRHGIHFERFISYAGSEFLCLAHRRRFMRHAAYENIRIPGKDRPGFRNLCKTPAEFEEKRTVLMDLPLRPHWRRLEGEPVYHTMRQLRPQHVRVGRFFTLLDFCRSEAAVTRGWSQAVPLSAEPQVQMARCVAEVLDPFVAAVGRVSVTRGVEAKSVAEAQQNAAMHRWVGPAGRVEFVTPHKHCDVTLVAALKALRDHPKVCFADAVDHPAGGVKVTIEVRRFAPSKVWTSARESEPEVHTPAARTHAPRVRTRPAPTQTLLF